MKKPRGRLPIPIPRDYAEALGVDRSYISHVNAGRSQMSLDLSLKLMEIAQEDPRMEGFDLLHLRPELRRAKKWLCRPTHRKK